MLVFTGTAFSHSCYSYHAVAEGGPSYTGCHQPSCNNITDEDDALFI